MKIETKIDTDLTVQSFAYMARKLASSSAAAASAQYEQILSEAEKHRCALRLMRRDALEMAEQGLRKRALTKADFVRLDETTAQAVTQAQQAITRIAEQYVPQRMAA